MFEIALKEIASILLFFYAIHRFSKIMMRCNIHKMRTFISRMIGTPAKSFTIGVIVAGFMQSNRAVSSIALTLVNSGIISASAIMPILLGAPLGAGSTAFLVSMKISLVEEILIIIGAIIKKTKYKNIGHIIFYLGLLLLSLDLMSEATSSLKDNEHFTKMFLFTDNAIALFFVGFFEALLLQSGALAISMITILTSYNILPLYNAMYAGIGVVAGSSFSLFIITLNMNTNSKKVCYTNILLIFVCSIASLVFVPHINYLIKDISNTALAFAISNLLLRSFISFSATMLFYLFIKNNFIAKFMKIFFKKAQRKNS